MTTIKDIKDQVTELASYFTLLDDFDNEIQKVSDEISASSPQTFESFRDTEAKKKYLVELQNQRTQVEQQKQSQIIHKARHLPIRSYLDDSLYNDVELLNLRKSIESQAVSLIEMVENYNDTYIKKAKSLSDEVLGTGVSDILDKVNNLENIHRGISPYVNDPVVGFIGTERDTLNYRQSPGELISQIKRLEV